MSPITKRPPGRQCGPGYSVGAEGCRHGAHPMQLQDRCDGWETTPHLADFEARNPVSDREIMGFWLWIICKPIWWAAGVQGRIIDRRNRHLHEGD